MRKCGLQSPWQLGTTAKNVLTQELYHWRNNNNNLKLKKNFFAVIFIFTIIFIILAMLVVGSQEY